MKNRRYIATMVSLLLMMGASASAYGQTVHGKVFGGGQLAQVNGQATKVNGDAADAACSVTINSGSVYGEVYGAGEGVKIYEAGYDADVAKVTGDTKVHLGVGRGGGGTAWRDIFGGGALAKVQGDTYVSMSGGHIAANLFGGGMGDIRKVSAEPDAEYYRDGGSLQITSADITGNTNVDITGGDIVWNRTSSTTTTSNSTTTYTYTKTVAAQTGQSATEERETNDQQTAIKESYESQGYTDVTVGEPSGTEAPYTYAVTYTIPGYTLVETTNSPSSDLVSAGYELTNTSTEDNSTVEGEIVWWNPENQSLADNTVVDGKKYYNSKFYDAEKKKFLIKHNIFGGGYVACRVGTYDADGVVAENTGNSSVKMVRGLFGQDLIDTEQWKACYNDNQDPHFYVFGGGFGAYTSVGDTKVYIGVDKDEEYEDITTDVQWAKPMGGQRKGGLAANSKGGIGSRAGDPGDGDGDGDGTIGIRDNSYGLPQYTILGVLGGGYAGVVTGNTDVQVGGNTFMHRIYGGGYGQLAAYNELNESPTADPKTNRTGTDWIFDQGSSPTADTFAEKLHALNRQDLGIVMGNTSVKTDGGYIQGDVFGGGAGVVAAKLVTAGNSTSGSESGTLTDFRMGEVVGVTEVEIAGNAEIRGSVYGGGDVARVLGTGATRQTTKVTVKAGTIIENVFGGGSGRVASIVASTTDVDINGVTAKTVNVGGIVGNALVTIENTVNDDGEIEATPSIFGNIYGGGAYGQIEKSANEATDGNTIVNIEGGNIGGEIFGGGKGDIRMVSEAESFTAANIAGNTVVNINGGTALWQVIADGNGNTKEWHPETGFLLPADLLTIRKAMISADKTPIQDLLRSHVDADFFNVDSCKFTKDHNIYGGGDRVCVVGGVANVTMNHALITDNMLLNPQNAAGLAWAASIDNKEHPQFSVFGGGYGPNTFITRNTIVSMQCGKNEVLYTKAEADALNTANSKNPGDDGYVIPGSKKSDFTYTNQETDRQAWNDFFNQTLSEWGSLSSADKENNYGGNNQAGIWRYAVSKLAWSSGLPNLIQKGLYGGGYAGLVGGSSIVTVSDYSCLRYVYGGGLGSVDYLAKYDGDRRENLYNRLGEVAGSAVVNLMGGVISGEVYGGGVGMESKQFTVEDGKLKTMLSAADEGFDNTQATDFVDMGRIKGTTKVIVPAATATPNVDENGTKGLVVFGDVFGGGDVANVGMETSLTDHADAPELDGYFTSMVTIGGGAMMGQVFAGGNGRLKTQTKDYKSLGAIYGNTLLDIDGYDSSSSAGQGTDTHGKGITYIFKRVFGGGNNGSVRKVKVSDVGDANTGHAYVAVKGGYLAYNVFGGGVGTVDMPLDNEGNPIDNNTYSYIEGDTYVDMAGGLAILDQYWDKPDDATGLSMRQWGAVQEHEGKRYSPQYDPVKHKMLINHNVYAGCRNAGYVKGSTHLKMSRSYLRSSMRVRPDLEITDDYSFFRTDEWKEVYEKIGSPHFCIFGGGFGAQTHVGRDTWVRISIENAGLSSPVALSQSQCEDAHGIQIPVSERYKLFEGGQSVMDVVGGGYSGETEGTTHVIMEGDVFARRIFGGAFYATSGNTHVRVKSANVDDIFAGGMMGDVTGTATVDVGLLPYSGSHADLKPIDNNSKIFINNNIYGGNDVSGKVSDQITVNIFGGKIYGNVYGAGNGNYLYAINEAVSEVTTHEGYESNGQTYDLVYEVPKREAMDFSMVTATDAEKIVNINTYRPDAQKVKLNIGGTDSEYPVVIKGNVFGGGNTATVFGGASTDPSAKTSVEFNIGSHCNIGGVFMGADGDAMFQEENGFMEAFQKINGVTLENSIEWLTNPRDKLISDDYLPVKLEDRPKVYPHVLDLYFEPVEMSVQPTLNWCGGFALPVDVESLSDDDAVDVVASPSGTRNSDINNLTNNTIGIFVCGGNRGNMNVDPWDGSSENPGGNAAEAGHIVNYRFPSGLTITNRIVGGCNEANYKLGNVTHEGGYLLGGRKYDGTEINLLVECQFAMPQGMTSLLAGGKPLIDTKGDPIEQRNVYGGCYKSGTIVGDINIDFRSSMLTTENTGSDDASASEVAKAYFGSEVAMGNVYGAGYGPESYVYGDTKVIINPTKVMMDASPAKGMRRSGEKVVDNNAYAAMSVYGGGQQGNVIGNTTVRVLNGHIGKSVAGGSYAGYMWGSTQVLVGYPKYYIAQKSGKYQMARADKWNVGEDYKNHDGSDVVKQQIYLMAGDIVSEEVFNAIAAYDAKNSTSQATTGVGNNFSAEVTTRPSDSGLTWSDINIVIDEAAYGGGYSLASGSSVAAGTYTVKKYDKTMNLDDEMSSTQLEDLDNDNTTKGFGGNTTVLVWDNNAIAQTKDHISISTQTMKEVTLPNGTDLFGYYYRRGDGTYGYIYQEGEYFYGTGSGSGTYYTQAFESDSEGGMYGDGHLSFAEGFRAGELVGYGFSGSEPNGAKIINTFQRMDMLRLKDCSVAVLGARDYTVNEISKTPYSIARIGELQMIANNVVVGDGIKSYKTGNGDETDVFADGQLLPTVNPHSRNYLGLSNNIHYLGAVMSNVDFNDKYQYGNKDTENNANGKKDTKSYREIKQEYVTNTISNPAEFQKRNDGTAKNMIGISSGYAMKVQNVQTTTNAATEEYFYGPIVGVVEMNLIDVREDEGGGYVYADNIHHRTATAIDYAVGNYDQVPTSKDQDEDFLEVSGNFVFPYDVQKNRYIVDDCFPTGFEGTEARAEGHYWYVTGYNYYYNAHITGYTYNSTESPLYFNSDKDALLTLTGAKIGQQITLQSLKWRSNHDTTDGFEACDLQTAKEPGEKADGYGNKVIRLEDDNGEIEGVLGAGPVFEHNSYNHYNLHLGIADNEGKYAISRSVKPENGTNVSSGYYSDEDCTVTASGTADGETVYYQKLSYWNNLPLTTNLPSSSSRSLVNGLSVADPVLTFQLKDEVDNSGDTYFQKYMAQPCEATLVLTCPATEGDGVTPKKGYVPISYFFKQGGSSPNFTYSKMTDGTKLIPTTVEEYNKANGTNISQSEFEALTDVQKKSITYYYFGNGNDYHPVAVKDLLFYDKSVQRYVPVDKTAFTYEEYKNTEGNTTITEEQYNDLPTIEASKIISGSQEYTFYHHAARTYTYTIYLTIDYVQGPDVKGNLKIYNCALPGEKIKIDKGSIEITADASMSQTSTTWKFRHGDDEYVFDQANPFDEEAASNTTSEMLKDVEYDEPNNCIYVPAYYFMNGYDVEYWYTVNGISNEFKAPADENGNDHLLIHNYHRMKPRNPAGTGKADVDFKLYEAQKRIIAETKAADDMPESTEEERAAKAAAIQAILPEPRIYIADASDLNELPRFLAEKAITYKNLVEYNADKDEEHKLTQEQFNALPSTQKEKGVGAVGSKYDFGNHMQFHLLNDIVVNNVGLSNLQDDHYGDIATFSDLDFKGTLNGNGYVISDLGATKGVFTAPTYLFPANHGNIHNLGLKEGVITMDDAGVDNDKYHCCYTWSDKTVYRMNGKAVGTTADGADGTYTEFDWRYGKVTYDLNQYYLERRAGDDAKIDNDVALAKPMKAIAVKGAYDGTYVENLYKNGDYLYARWQTASPEYLRTTASQYDANYNSQTSYHRFSLNNETWELTHPVDVNREVVIDSQHDHYQPLFDESSVGDHNGDIKSDYVFFGQTLDKDTKGADLGTIDQTIPEHIAHDLDHDVSLMANRVYRASGYYGTKHNNGYYYNHKAYVHDNGITAIDFYGVVDPVEAGEKIHTIGYYPAGNGDGKVFYAPQIDNGITGIDINKAVTQNLLVYTPAEHESVAGPEMYSKPMGSRAEEGDLVLPTYNEIWQIVNDELDYTEGTSESRIKGHHVEHVTPAVHGANFQTQNGLLHLVERSSDDKNGEGEACQNNDFNAPIAFDVATHAWYTRRPAYFANAQSATVHIPKWEGLALPFTVNRTEAHMLANVWKREMTHFYGATPASLEEGATEQGNGNQSEQGITGHDYWLRGLVAVTEDGNTTAKFARPAGSSDTGLFYHTDAVTDTYNYYSSFFNAHYNGYSLGDRHAQFSGYYFQTQDIPYVVSFPGAGYFEFDMTNQFFNKMQLAGKLKGSYEPEPNAQSVVFNWYASNSNEHNPDVPDAEKTDDKYLKSSTKPESCVIAVTDDAVPSRSTTVTVGSVNYTHKAVYAELTTSADNEYEYVVNGDGSAFENRNSSTVMPFRTYITSASVSSAKRGKIYIGAGAESQKEGPVPGIQDVDPETGEGFGPQLLIYSVNHDIIVESPYPMTISIHNAAGQLNRTVNVEEGRNLYTGFPNGVYIVHGKKIVVR